VFLVVSDALKVVSCAAHFSVGPRPVPLVTAYSDVARDLLKKFMPTEDCLTFCLVRWVWVIGCALQIIFCFHWLRERSIDH
jgi:hypothetical protein